ncbi:MAG: IS607 family transposase [Actinobacteria bacterium]|nr:IS607 family transposase [Actinomycetota bacterium]MCG2819952.1 IS607 family transposase [Actinomycetes bacterium]MBU4179282.1 IS607 family transposase [Actinomycetota bacterium]MBU4218932.1 IS607 family transposase [Actinomycetota bacterium]MBU4359797.1 IS607 family transposase [Actinomycetota bacterium]
MKLSVWAKEQGISYQTAWRWYKAGKLPVPAEQMPSGAIIVHPPREPVTSDVVTIYARVSSRDQRDDLARQVERLASYASAKGLVLTGLVEEIGSGLNGGRRKLIRLLSDDKARTILVEHRDRLTRFGFEFIEAAMMSQGRSIIVADETEDTKDIWADFIDVVTSMCASIYGKRTARNRAKKAVEAVSDSEDQAGLQDGA